MDVFAGDDQCDINTCLNGGTCYDLGHSFTCVCPSGWEGNSCQLCKFTALIVVSDIVILISRDGFVLIWDILLPVFVPQDRRGTHVNSVSLPIET